MNRLHPPYSLFISFVLVYIFADVTSIAEEYKPIPRRLPPPGIKIPADVKKKLQKRLKEIEAALDQIDYSDGWQTANDPYVYTKAVRYALENNEFYSTADFKIAEKLLNTAARLEQKNRGLLVCGYRSKLDGSVQPYGLEIPEKLDLTKMVPLYVWLHGRGDKTTELRFIHKRKTKAGQFKFNNGIVLHPFGRHCNGFKLAGEIDVIEAVEAVCSRYNIDRNRITLMGFSMGGAGCWHIGAKYPDRWCAVCPGAGFAETAKYIKLKKENYPAIYEQKLWQLNDTPGYVRNLFNTRVVAYSGEIDKQKQAALVMEKAYAAAGQKLQHIIGPKMGHKYHPDSILQISKIVNQATKKGIDRWPMKVSLQTPTLKYNRARWLEIRCLAEHWRNSHIVAEVQQDKKSIKITTKNVRVFAIHIDPSKNALFKDVRTVNLDDQILKIDQDHLKGKKLYFARGLDSESGDKKTKWSYSTKELPGQNNTRIKKRHNLQGPIDDAFTQPFLVVTGSGKCANEKIQRWVDFELAHFKDRWRRIFRGDVRIKKDTEVTAEDMKNYNLILWGDANSNKLIKRFGLPSSIKWKQDEIVLGKKKYNSANHVVSMIYPNRENRTRYIVLNSGFTFREAHDRTNSLQNPKLPDWAIIDISEAPSAQRPGKIAAAGFFDENWLLKK